jgi:hypothetical protein
LSVILIYFELGANATFHDPSCVLSVRKVMASEEEEEEGDVKSFVVATYILPAAQWQCMHSAWTNY